MKVAIIGAGLTGLTAARALSGRADVTLFDKSRGVGGRMSTRYAGDYEFDHGAQYFTAKTPGFKAEVEAAVAAGYLAPWRARAFYQTACGWEPDTGDARYVGTPRMNSWGKGLLAGLSAKVTCHLGMRITDISRDETWTLSADTDQVFSGFDHVLLAIPSPQAAALLPHDFAHYGRVKDIQMDACFALMVGFDAAFETDWDSLRVMDGPVAWVALNSAKPGRASPLTLVVHTRPDWSNRHADDDRNVLQAAIEQATTKVTSLDIATAPHKVLHRWLYASNTQTADAACLRDDAMALSVAGDWCLGGRVENAYLSGLAAAQGIIGA